MLLTSRENLRIRALNQTAEAVIAASGAAYPTRDARQPASRLEQWESAPARIPSRAGAQAPRQGHWQLIS
jgi:hypothetical protein